MANDHFACFLARRPEPGARTAFGLHYVIGDRTHNFMLLALAADRLYSGARR